MRSVTLAAGLLAAAVICIGCIASAGQPGGDRNFTVHLSGSQEVPPRATPAHGVAKIEISKNGSSIDYKLNVAEISNVVASHIHVGPAGVNGPIVAFLYGSVPPGGGPIQGRIASGTITAASLVGPLAGQPLSALIDGIRAGNAYVNVHTNDGVDPINTGPGDFPGGEIRGQF